MKTLFCLIGLLTILGTSGCAHDHDHDHRGGYYGHHEYDHGHYYDHHHDWDDRNYGDPDFHH